MKARPRDLVLALAGTLLLPLVFIALQAVLARYSVPLILVLHHVAGYRAATTFVIYGFGVVGAASSAMLIGLPSGFWLTWRPWVVGFIVGVLAVLQMASEFESSNSNNYLEYVSLIVFSAVAADIGRRMRVRSLKPDVPCSGRS